MGTVIPINSKSRWREVAEIELLLTQQRYRARKQPVPHTLVLELNWRYWQETDDFVNLLLNAPPEPPTPSA